MIHLTDTFDYQENEKFVPLDVQNGTTYGDAKNTDKITYTEQESFLSEEGDKIADLQAPVCGTK